jgi:hypothetical protein
MASINDLQQPPETPRCKATSSVASLAAKRRLRRLAGLVYEGYRRPAWFRLRRFLFRLFDFASTCVFISHAGRMPQFRIRGENLSGVAKILGVVYLETEKHFSESYT